MPQTSSKTLKLCDLISKGSIYFLILLLPIFFLPWTANVLDFNKQALLVVLVLISLSAWLLKILISGKFSFNLSWIHIPVAVLFSVYLVSTIFSLWSYGSFWGWPQITSESLLSLLCLVILYFLVINIFRKQEIVYSMILLAFSGFLAMLFGTLQLFGRFLFSSGFAKIISFNTIGAVNSLGLFTAALLPLIIVFIINSKAFFLRIFFIVTAILSTILLVLINFSVAWWMVIIGAVLVITLGMQKREFFDTRWLVLPMFFLALALFFNFFEFQIPGVPLRPIEVFLTHRASFDIAWETLKERPVLGSGPGTFIFDFSKYKKIDFNQSQLWGVRFERGSSKILNTLTTTGILGILSFLALIGLFIFYGIKSLFGKPARIATQSVAGGPNKTPAPKGGASSTRLSSEEQDSAKGIVRGTKDEEERIDKRFLWVLSAGIFMSFVVLSAGYFLYQSNLSLNFAYFLLMAGFIALVSPAHPNFSPKNLGGPAQKELLLKSSSLVTLSITFVFTLVFVFSLGVLILEGQRYTAEVSYLKGIESWQQEGNSGDAMKYLEKAVRINPRVDLYWRELSQVYLRKVNEVAARTDLSQEEINRQVQIFINNAINAAKIATDTNPKNVANWSVRGFVYQSMIGVIGGVKDWTVKSYEEALKLEPTNPYFPTQTGIALLREASFLFQEKEAERENIFGEAKNQFKKAIEMKSDYAPARFQIAMIYQAQGKTEEAIEELEKTKSLVPFDIGLAFQLGLIYYQNKDYKKAEAELERTVLLNPDYANALYFLGLTYDKLGEREKAIEKFEKIAVLNPDNSEVKKILGNLKAGENALAGVIEGVPPTVPIEEEPPEIKEESPEAEE